MGPENTRRRDYVKAGLVWLVVVLLWSLHPELESDLIDEADTLSYGSFQSHVGHRWIFVAVVKTFTNLGFSLHGAAICLNSVALLYLLWLLLRYLGNLRSSASPAFVLLACVASPLLLLQKNILSSDLFSGLLFFHAFVLLEERRERLGAEIRFGALWLPALLLILAQNVKVTAILGCVAYGLVLLLERPDRRPGIFRMLLYLAFWFAFFFLIETLVTFWIYGDPLHRILETLRKPKGGNAPHEIAGARRSVPVPLVFYHLFSHVKIIGRYGIPAFTSLASLWIFRRMTVSRIYLALLLIFSLIGFRGMLTMERYWLLCLPFQLILYILLLSKIVGSPRLRRRYAAPALICSALGVSLVNYFFRFYPALYIHVGEMILRK